MTSSRLQTLITASLIAVVSLLSPHAQADFLVSSGRTNSVLQYNQTTGAFVQAFVPSRSGGLHNPQGLAMGPNGHLYVASFETDRILRYDGTTGAFIDAFVPNVGGGFGPGDLTFGPDGNLYISDFSAGVVRYDGTTGAFIDNFIPGFLGNTGIVFHTDGHLYVSLAIANEVRRYNGTTGAFIDRFVTAGSGGLHTPRGLTFGPDGHLYVVSGETDAVLRYHGMTGAFIDAFVPTGSGRLDAPIDLLFGPDKHLYVTGFDTGVLRYHGGTGAFMDTFIPAGSGGLGGATYFMLMLAPDRDHDGVSDNEDACPNSALNPTIVIDGCHTGVDNELFVEHAAFGHGCTMADLVTNCLEGSRNHIRALLCVTRLTKDLRRAGVIRVHETIGILGCTVQSLLP